MKVATILLLIFCFQAGNTLLAQDDIMYAGTMDMNIVIPVGSDLPLKYRWLDRMLVEIECTPVEGFVWKIKVLNSGHFNTIRATKGKIKKGFFGKIRKPHLKRTIEIRSETVTLTGFRRWRKDPPVLIPFLERKGNATASQKIPFQFKLTETIRPSLLSRLLHNGSSGVVQNVIRKGDIHNTPSEENSGGTAITVESTAGNSDDKLLIFTPGNYSVRNSKENKSGETAARIPPSELPSYIFSRNNAPRPLPGHLVGRIKLDPKVGIPVKFYIVGKDIPPDSIDKIQKKMETDLRNADFLFKQNCLGMKFNEPDPVVYINKDFPKPCAGFSCFCSGDGALSSILKSNGNYSDKHINIYYFYSTSRAGTQIGYSCNPGCFPNSNSRFDNSSLGNAIWVDARRATDWVLPHELGHFLHLCHGGSDLIGNQNLMRTYELRPSSSGKPEQNYSETIHLQELLTFGQVIKANFSGFSGIRKFAERSKLIEYGRGDLENNSLHSSCACLTNTLYQPQETPRIP